MTPSIKQKLHDLIDSIDNDSVLNQFYTFLYKRNISKEGDLWNKLSPEQQEEVLLSLDESNDPANLIANEEAKKYHEKWF